MTDSQLHITNLLNHLQEKFQFTTTEENSIAEVVKITPLKKKDNLIAPGTVSNHMNFISQGCLRTYYVDQEGQERTLQLGIENWWINDLYGYITGKPSKMYVQAMEASVVVQIPKSKLEVLYTEIPAISHFFRDKIQSAYVALQERTIENMSNDSYERYMAFRTLYRDIEQRVPQYIVASYLGITPEFLSYLRKKHAKELS